jgi:hypothetical protein
VGLRRAISLLVPFFAAAIPAAALAQQPASPAAAVPAGPARLEIKTSDAKGFVFIDGKVSGEEGSFTGDIPPGAHVIEVRREGFDTYKKSLTLTPGQTYAETVTLVRPADVVAQSASTIDRPLLGVIGGFGLFGVAQVGGMGTELETGCGALGASSCDTPSSLGAGLFGFVGYTWDPVGFELMIGGLADVATQKAHFDGNLSNGQNPLLAAPARDEKFTLFRAGPFGAIRARATFQNRVVRGTFAAGLGLSYRQVFMQRKAASADGTLTDTFNPDSTSYVSPGVSVDAAVQLRVSASTALALGVMLWAESAGSSVATAPDPHRNLGGNGQFTPISTPQYHVATGSQVFLGPYLGMMFGP